MDEGIADPGAHLQGRSRSSRSGSRTRTGRYALLKTYPICRWSGELGPKVKEGDRQAPEGFYTITPGQMNPNSQLLSRRSISAIPNAYDRAHGRTGAYLMVHGDCSSRGCYAMTDEQIARNLRARPRVVLRRPEIVPGPGLSVPDDADQHGQAPQLRRTWRSGRCSRRATTISRSPGRSRRSTSARSATCSTPQRRRTARRSASVRRGQCPAYEVPQEIAARGAARSSATDERRSPS